MELQHYGDNFIPVVPTNHAIHTPERPNCSDRDCPCYDGLKAQLQQQYMDGLVSADDATRILQGRQLWQ
jgi:hypothetical protein